MNWTTTDSLMWPGVFILAALCFVAGRQWEIDFGQKLFPCHIESREANGWIVHQNLTTCKKD